MKTKFGLIALHSIIISLSSLIIFYLFAYPIVSDGFSGMELPLFTLLSGAVYFFSILILNSYFNFSYLKQCYHDDIKPLKWYGNLLLIALGICIFSSLLDYAYFYLIDSSISEEFAEGLKSLITDSGKHEELDIFAQLPPFLQGYVLNFIAILISSLISIFIGRSIYTSSVSQGQIS